MYLKQCFGNLSIKLKLLFAILATCLVALALACTALFWFQYVTFRAGFAAELESLAANIAYNSSAPLTFDDRESAVEVLNALKSKSHITSACLYDSQGKLFAAIGSEASLGAKSHVPESDGVRFKDGYVSISLPVKVEGSRPGHLDLRARFTEQYQALVRLYLAVLFSVFVGTLIVVFLMSSMLQRLIAGPIVALADVANTVSERGDYSTRALEGGRDEVSLLARTFNRMLEQIQVRGERLEKSQQRYEVAVMGSSDGLWDWDLLTNDVYFSPRWKSMLGYQDADLPNALVAFQGLLHPDDLKPVMVKVESYLQGRDPFYDVEFRARCKDGTYRWILSRGAALRDDRGVAVRFAGSHSDITERKLSEEQIRIARIKFESLVNSVHGIVWEADPTDFRMLFVSNQAEQLLGYPASRWLEQADFWESTLHPDDRQATVEACKRGLAGRKPYQLEFRSMASDGKVVWLRESVSIEVDGDRPVRVRGVAIDITEQKRAMEEIARMQRELVTASRLAGMAEVATGVLHNVGNVLNSINVSSGLILEQLQASKIGSLGNAVRLLRAHPEDLMEFLAQDPKGRQLLVFIGAVSDQLTREQSILMGEVQALQQNIEHIKQIVAMQQSYAKVYGVLERVSASDLMEDGLRMISAGLSESGIEVVREFDQVPPILVDRHTTLQILVNLLSNAQQALEHRAEGRRLVLRVGVGMPGYVRFQVMDNGQGIDSENLTRIFQHGFTTKKSGHGFGLHSGANAAKQMGGSLLAQSGGPGQGATFTLELPLVETQQSTSDAPAGAGRGAEQAA